MIALKQLAFSLAFATAAVAAAQYIMSALNANHERLDRAH